MMHSSTKPAEPAARVVMNYDAEPIEFMSDVARIADPIKGKTVNGRARPAVTDTFKKDLANAADNGTRERILTTLVKDMDVKFDTIVGKETISDADMEKAVEAFAASAQNLGPD